MKIKKAKQKDIGQIINLLESLFTQESEFVFDKKLHKNALKLIIQDKKIGKIFVVRDGEKIIACLNILYTISTALGSKVALFEDIIVDKFFQSKGVGTKLLQKALNFLENKGIKRVTLLTDSDNFKAHQFYQKLGFKPSTMRPFRIKLGEKYGEN